MRITGVYAFPWSMAADARCTMQISTVASQALVVKELMTESQLGIAAVRQASDTQKQVADLMAQKATSVTPPKEGDRAGFSTYA